MILARVAPLWLMMAAGLCLAAGAPPAALVFKAEPVPGHETPTLWELERYGIETKTYSAGTLGPDFDADLRRARLLIFWTGSSGTGHLVFRTPETRAALREFLAAGGVLFFQYKGLPGPRTPEMQAWFRDLGVTVPPVMLEGAQFETTIATNVAHPLLTTPNTLAAITGPKIGPPAGYLYLPVPQGQVAVLHEKGTPGHAALLMQDHVAGKGLVLFSRISTMGSAEFMSRPFGKAFIENLLTVACGALGRGLPARMPAPGAMPVAGAGAGAGPCTRLPVDGFNPLYLRAAPEIPWGCTNGTVRVPILVHETGGMDRPGAPVEIAREYPAGVTPESLRVAAPWGEELPSQSRRAPGGTNVIETLFLADLLALEHRLVFVYYREGPASAPVYAPRVWLEADDHEFTLSNDALEARLHRAAPRAVGLRPRGSRTGNQFYDQGGMAPDGWGARFVPTNVVFAAGRVVEDGPLRKTVEYRGELGGSPVTVRYALTAGAPRLDYEIEATNRMNLTRDIRWSPGRGRHSDIPDACYFVTPDGLRRVAVVGFPTVTMDIAKDAGPAMLAEGWYAFEDGETGEACGELFERRAVRFEATVEGTRGYRVYTTSTFDPAAPRLAGAFAGVARGGVAQIRQAYREFKQPPEWVAGAPQARAAAPERWSVPVLGRQLWRGYHLTYGSDKFFFGFYDPDDPTRMIPHWLRDLKRRGGNVASLLSGSPLWPSRFTPPDARTGFMAELCRQAHAEGIAVGSCLVAVRNRRFYRDRLPAGFNDDLLDFKELPVAAAEDLAACDLDFCNLLDESLYRLRGEKSKARFRQQHGLEPVEQVEVARLAEPAHHLTALFQMDGYTEILEGMAKAMRARNPRILLSDQVNSSAMTHISAGAPHDWERQAAFLDTICMDLYEKPTSGYKFYVKFMRAMVGNTGPVLLINGCTTPARLAIANQNYPLMWGADALLHFPPRGFLEYEIFDEVQRNYRFLDHTGLGDMLAAYAPVKRVALLWDRAAMLDAIRRGLWSTPGSAYCQRVARLTFLRRLQTDIVMSKDFTPATLRAYPALVVVSDPVLADAHAETIRAYAEGGGAVLLEGESLRNARLQALAGVRWAGEPTQGQLAVAGTNGFSMWGTLCPVTPDGAETVATLTNGTPAVFRRAAGRGTVMATPLVLSEQVFVHDGVSAFVRRLLDGLAGPPPAEITRCTADELDAGWLTDGRNLVAAVYNPGIQDADLAWRWHGSNRPASVMAFSDGIVRSFTGAAAWTIPSGQIRFYFLGDPEAVAVPDPGAPVPCRGPGYSVWPGEDLAPAEAAEPAPAAAPRPALPAGWSRVGILTDRLADPPPQRPVLRGDEGLYAALQNREALQVEYIGDLETETLAGFDAVIVPNPVKGAIPPMLRAGWEGRLRDYVARGGGALLCHHAVGAYPCEMMPFPELGSALACVVQRTVKIVQDHPVTTAASVLRRFPEKASNPAFQAQLEATAFKAGDVFQAGFVDYIPLKPAEGVAALAVGNPAGGGGDVVLMAGPVGRGRAVLCGLALGEKNLHEEGIAAGDENLLVNAVYWLTEKERP